MCNKEFKYTDGDICTQNDLANHMGYCCVRCCRIDIEKPKDNKTITNEFE